MKPHLESLQERQPLTELQGINLYDKARLFEEGIENVQNLVHQELTETMLNTRIPASRLVDWIDQGILSLHLGKDTHADASRNNVEVYDRRVLSECGILTATDLILAHKRAKPLNRSIAPDSVNWLFARVSAPLSRITEPDLVKSYRLLA